MVGCFWLSLFITISSLLFCSYIYSIDDIFISSDGIEVESFFHFGRVLFSYKKVLFIKMNLAFLFCRYIFSFFLFLLFCFLEKWNGFYPSKGCFSIKLLSFEIALTKIFVIEISYSVLIFCNGFTGVFLLLNLCQSCLS